MSTLQIGLAILGALVLALVMGHGAWSARRNRPRQAVPETSSGTAADAVRHKGAGSSAGALATGQRLDPSFDVGEGVTAGVDEAEAGADLTAATDPGSLPHRTRLAQPERNAGLDALIDAMAPIALEAVVSGDAALAAMPPTRRAGSKPFGVEGLNTVSGDWETPRAGQRYQAFQCGVQLANRTGALNQIEYSEFVIKTQAFADALGGEPEFPEMLEEVARARELDQFTSAHDAQLSFTLRANRTAWSPGYVLQSAARLGFVAGVIPGRMVLPAAEAGRASIIGLAFDTQAAMAEAPEQTALRELSLSLDVPQVERGEQPFARLCEIALALAASMDGSIIDDNGSPIRAEAMEIIHAELEQLYDRLEGHELAAGSVLARRVFS